jgi:hypothetical protein
MFLASAPVKADFDSSPSSPLERFAKSLVNVYVTAEMCKQINSLHTENYIIVIKNYMHSYFQESSPYWVLPVVNKQIESRDYCVYSIEANVTRYTEDSKEYAEHYPESPPPPVLNNYMMVDNRSYLDETKNSESAKDHFLTPAIVAK